MQRNQPDRTSSGTEPSAEAQEQLFHATTVSLAGVAAMIVAPPGGGKSDLALRCLVSGPNPLISAPPLLVSDDQTRVIRPAGECTLDVSAPGTLRGRIEVRGLGIITVPSTPRAKLALVVELTGEVPERHPVTPLPPTDILGVPVAKLLLRPFEASSPLKLLLALADPPRFARVPRISTV